MNRLTTLTLVAASLASTGCVTAKRYRFFPDETPPKGRRFLPASEPGPGYQLGFVEFDESGKYWAARQSTEALKLIQAAKQKNGHAVVFLYVHGWHNNADRRDRGLPEKDVERFQGALDFFGREVTGDKDVPPVVGIYVGWRGASLTPAPIKWTSYWTRRAAARRMGRGDLPDFIGQVIDATKKGTPNSRLFLIGHSFGSRVLEAAVDGIDFAGKPNEKRGIMAEWSKSGGTEKPPVDLVLYINAATPSTLTRGTVQRLQDKKFEYLHPDYDPAFCAINENHDDKRCRKYPLYAAITSTGDAATRYLLPTANLIVPPLPFSPYLRSAANTSVLRTHMTRSVACLKTPFECDPNGDLEMCFRTAGECSECFEVHQRPGAHGSSAFWIMQVEPSVVKNHGDIWNQSLVTMIRAMLRPSEALNVNKTRQYSIGGRVYK